MPIELNDKRTRSASTTTGTPQPPVPDGDEVLVQPLTTYMEGSEMVGLHTEPYPMPRHHANELKAQGFAEIIETGERRAEPGETEQTTGAGAPIAAETGPDSTVPARPGAQPSAETIVGNDGRPRGRRGPARV